MKLAIQGAATLRFRVALTLAWASAARGADLRLLVAEDLRVLDGSAVEIRFVGSKTDPFLLGQWVVVQLTRSDVADLRMVMSSTPRGEKLFPYTTQTIAAHLRRFGPYSAHSIRRGALTTVILAGASTSDAILLSRHRDVTGLLRYVPLARTEFGRRQRVLSTLLQL